MVEKYNNKNRSNFISVVREAGGKGTVRGLLYDLYSGKFLLDKYNVLV